LPVDHEPRKGNEPVVGSSAERDGTGIATLRFGTVSALSHVNTDAVLAYLFQCDEHGLFAVTPRSHSPQYPARR
jgi:hypothetical protein